MLIRESGDGEVVAVNLERVEVQDELQLLQCIDKGNASRITHATEANETSSRSHAICAIELRDRRGNIYGGQCCFESLVLCGCNPLLWYLAGKLSIIDLAGSERAADTRHHNRQRRVESAEINKSLLALKECIRWVPVCRGMRIPPPRRLMMNLLHPSASASACCCHSALGSGSSHVPFRASKLTLLLRDSFTNPQARVTMVATVSPAASASDHTGNTLRYEKCLRCNASLCHLTGRCGFGFGCLAMLTASRRRAAAAVHRPPLVVAVLHLAMAAAAERLCHRSEVRLCTETMLRHCMKDAYHHWPLRAA